MRPTHWQRTGRVAYRRRLLIGPKRMMVEETRREFRPVAIGHTPANWQPVRRWRWATRAESAQADRDWLHIWSAAFAETIPMPPFIKGRR